MHDSLFEPLRFGALEAKNRIWMAPLTRGRSTQPGSVPNEMMATYYRQRAGAGLIVTEATGISVEGLGWPAAPGIWSDEPVEARPAGAQDAGEPHVDYVTGNLTGFLQDVLRTLQPEWGESGR